MKDRICTLSKNDLKYLVKTYHITLDLHPRLPDHGFTINCLRADAIGIYSEFLRFSGVRVPFSTFLLSVLKYFKVHISQLVPLGLNKVVSFEVVCRDLNIVPTVTLFRVFQCLCKQGDWFSFSKRHNTEDVCMEDGPSSLNKWKDKFFLIDRRAIPNYLTWRHSCSCVLNDLPSDGYDRNDMQRLCARLICLREMRGRIDDNAEISMYDFMTLPSWSDAKIVEESHHLSLPLLELVPSHTTTPALEGAIIPLPTLDEIAASLPDSRLVKNAIELDHAEGSDEADLADLCAEIEDSLERDEAVSMRVVLALTPRLGKRLGAPPFIVVTSVSDPSHVETLAPASTSGRSLSLGGVVAGGRVGKSGAQMGEVMRRQMDPLDCLARSALAHDAEYDHIPDDDCGTATRGEEIDLTLFPLALGPYHMPYQYEGVSSPLKALDQTITPAELRRTESLLPLELSNRVNVLSALLVSHGYELNSRYANLVSSKAHLQEKFDKKKGDVKLLRSEVTSLDSKLENLQRGYDTLGQENRELHSKRDASSKENELVLEKSKSQEYKDAMDGLREEVTQFVGSGVESLVRKLLSSDEFHAALARVASLGINYGTDFDKALDDFPTTPFPFLSKIFAASEGGLPDVAQILLDKFAHSATSVAVASSRASEAP
ncbi:hypothetical protein Tco_1492164 [Tanacetum coccineum]